MNFKILLRMVILVSMHSQVHSCVSFFSTRENEISNKLAQIGVSKLTDNSDFRIHEFDKALDNDDYNLAFSILHEFSLLHRNTSEYCGIECCITVKGVILTLAMIDETSKKGKEKIKKKQEELQIIRTFVEDRKPKEAKRSANEVVRNVQETADPSKSCAVQ